MRVTEADRRRDLADPAGAPHLRRRLGAPGAPGGGPVRRVRGAQHPRPARRPARATCAAQWTPHPEGLDHADQLVALIRTLGDFTVGVAAFPDVHPDSPDLDHDVEVLVRKADAGASFAITQMVFDADTYLRLRDRVAARRELPITPGLMPVTNLRQITRMSELMGTPLPPAVVARLEAVKDDPAAVRAVGVQIATELGQRMLDEGAPGIHFITMNRSTATLEVFENLVALSGGRTRSASRNSRTVVDAAAEAHVLAVGGRLGLGERLGRRGVDEVEGGVGERERRAAGGG